MTSKKPPAFDLYADCEPVPDEFRELGWTGLFTTEASATPEVLDIWEPKMPCLIRGNWMALRANRDRGTITLVRNDADAVVEAFTGRPRGQ